jgi:hypothetical protein
MTLGAKLLVILGATWLLLNPKLCPYYPHLEEKAKMKESMGTGKGN